MSMNSIVIDVSCSHQSHREWVAQDANCPRASMSRDLKTPNASRPRVPRNEIPAVPLCS